MSSFLYLFNTDKDPAGVPHLIHHSVQFTVWKHFLQGRVHKPLFEAESLVLPRRFPASFESDGGSPEES